MEIKVPTIKEILDFMCKPRVRLNTLIAAVAIFMINLILLFLFQNKGYNGVLGNIIGWGVLILSWINNALYNHKGYGRQATISWQDELKKKYGGYND